MSYERCARLAELEYGMASPPSAQRNSVSVAGPGCLLPSSQRYEGFAEGTQTCHPNPPRLGASKQHTAMAEEIQGVLTLGDPHCAQAVT